MKSTLKEGEKRFRARKKMETSTLYLKIPTAIYNLAVREAEANGLTTSFQIRTWLEEFVARKSA